MASKTVRDLWVDFNAVTPKGVVHSLLAFATDAERIRPGVEIAIGDDEGNVARGVVLEVADGGVVAVEVVPATFVPAVPDSAASF